MDDVVATEGLSNQILYDLIVFAGLSDDSWMKN
jgi:hypothetical protein